MKTNAFILLFSAVLLFIVYQMPFKTKFYGDWTFHAEAKVVANWVWGKAVFKDVTITKAPGPVLFFSVPYTLAGPEKADGDYWRWALAWNFLWLSLAIICIKDTAALLFGARQRLCAVLSALLLPLHLYYGIGVLAEPLAFTGCSLFMYGTTALFLRKVKPVSRIDWASVAVVVGLLFLVTARPNILLVLVLLPVALFALRRWGNPSLRPQLRHFFRVYVITCIGVSALTIGLRFLPGNRTQALQESYFVYVAHHGRFQFRTETWDWRFWESDIRPDSKDYQAWQASTRSLQEEIKSSGRTQNQVYGNWLLQDALAWPFTLVKQFFVRILFGHYLQISSAPSEKLAIGPFQGIHVYYGLHGVINLLNLLLIFAALKSIVRHYREYPFLILLCIPWIALALFHGFVYMEHRYMFPARPIILVLASASISVWFSKIKKAI